jgi:uncharacterized protein YdcH (DUF465 family)
MENSSASLREHLIGIDAEFKSLVEQHREYEARLEQLTALPYPTEEEMLEETLLKKKKLLLKDKMEAIVHRYKRQAVGQ